MIETINTKKLSSLLKMLDRNYVTLFKLGNIEIHREIVDNGIHDSVAYDQQYIDNKNEEIQNAIDELKELEEDNLMITDPEEYERSLSV